MPHLAPISWIMTLSIFWFLLITMLSFLWWQQPMSIKLSYHSNPVLFKKWNWYFG